MNEVSLARKSHDDNGQPAQAEESPRFLPTFLASYRGCLPMLDLQLFKYFFLSFFFPPLLLLHKIVIFKGLSGFRWINIRRREGGGTRVVPS